MSEDREIAVVTPEAAKQKAIKTIDGYAEEGALVYVRPEDLETQGTFYPVPTCVRCTPGDFHKISGGKLMPKGHHTQLIARATGTNIVDATTRKEGPYTFVGHARGARRMPDGTMLEAVAEYEFDAELRAEEDFLKDESKYPDERAKRRHVLELARFGRARAETGASLRVIRKLAGIPTAFDPGDIQKAMVFARIELNTDRLLSNPVTAQAALKNAIGVKAEIYGGGEEGAKALPGPEEHEGTVENGDEPEESEPPFDDVPGFEDDDPVTVLRRWFTTTKLAGVPEKTAKWIDDLLDGPDGHDEEKLQGWKAKLEKALAERKEGGAA